MKVIIVGNAKSLLEQENGNAIDSFDVVIRCNEFVLNDYGKHAGTKTDIIAVPANEIIKKIASKVGRTENENYIQQVNTVWYTRSKRWVEKTTKCSEIAKMTNIVNFEHICDEDFNKIVGKFRKCDPKIIVLIKRSSGGSTWPSTGLIAILRAVATYPDDDIYVTGFNSFATGHYFKDEKRCQDSITRPIGDHNKEIEKKFFKKIVEQHNIKVL
jgi:hypothetical protein